MSVFEEAVVVAEPKNVPTELADVLELLELGEPGLALLRTVLAKEFRFDGASDGERVAYRCVRESEGWQWYRFSAPTLAELVEKLAGVVRQIETAGVAG